MAGPWRVLAHGGAGSDPELTPATDAAAEAALEALEDGAEPLAAACRAVARLEDDGRFNAGRGSNVRADGSTVQMDAACADSRGRFGAVACVEGVRYPVRAAEAVADTDHAILAGEGARRFARERGVPELDLGPRGASGEAAGGADTVGCVVGDGEAFAAALSSGGTREAMVGRVGDVPLPGCGLRAGGAGAVAATGHGETIAMRRTADRAYRALAAGRDPEAVVQATLGAAGDALMGLIAVDARAGAGGSNRKMAYSRRVG